PGSSRLTTISLTQSAYRKAVAQALEKVGVGDVKTAVPALRQALRDPDPQVRNQVVGVVAAMKGEGKALATDLVTLCKSADTQQAAEDALVKLGADVVPVLAKQLETRDRALALGVIKVLAKMGPAAKQ